MSNLSALSIFQTRILVTHSLSYLPQMDNILVIDNGVISEQGTYQQLLDVKDGVFADFLKTYLKQDGEKTEGTRLTQFYDSWVSESIQHTHPRVIKLGYHHVYYITMTRRASNLPVSNSFLIWSDLSHLFELPSLIFNRNHLFYYLLLHVVFLISDIEDVISLPDKA